MPDFIRSPQPTREAPFPAPPHWTCRVSRLYLNLHPVFRRLDPPPGGGGGDDRSLQIQSEGDTNIHVPVVPILFCALVHMVTWHNVIIAFSSVTDSADNTEVRHVLSNWEAVRSWSLKIRTFSLESLAVGLGPPYVCNGSTLRPLLHFLRGYQSVPLLPISAH